MTPGEGGLTLGERIRRIEDTGDTTLKLVQELESRDRADLLRHETHATRLDKIEGDLRWAVRTVVGAILLGLVAVVRTIG